MGSSYFGEPNFGNERASGSSSSSSSSSSRKGKKNNSEKPKQPQRGLGVAQLEKIRLHGQIACAYHPPPLHNTPYPSNFNNEDPRMQQIGEITYSSAPSSSSSFSYSPSSTSYSASYGFQPNTVMGLPEHDKTNIRYGDSQPTNIASWEHANAIMENQIPTQSNITRPFLNVHDSHDIDTKQRSGNSVRSGQNSESSDTQELDLELRLSL